MGYTMGFNGEIPAAYIKDRDKVLGVLADLTKRTGREWSEDQSAENRYDVSGWYDEETGAIVVSEDTKDWGDWIEKTLKAIAPFIDGEHVINVVGEDGDEWDLIVRDGTLYKAVYNKTRGDQEEWKGE